MTTIYLIRHARPNVANHDDRTRELSREGLRDRMALVRYFADRPLDAVLSSPYRRAVETVRPLAAAHGLTIETVWDFREREGGGDGWMEDYEGFCRKQWSDFHYKLPGGESLAEVQRRTMAALEKTLREHEGQTVAIGGHGTAICALLHGLDASFGYEGFAAMKRLMPWVVRLDFDALRLIRWYPVGLDNGVDESVRNAQTDE